MSHLSSQAYGDSVPQHLIDLAQPHVDSFDYFLGEGMEQAVENLEGIEVGWVTNREGHVLLGAELVLS
jgi:hypothetical protein